MKNLVIGCAVAVVSMYSFNTSANCEVSLTTSAYINWNAINASQVAGLYQSVETEHDCKLKINYQPDYMVSLPLFTSKRVDAVTVTNLDQLTLLSGRQSQAVVLQDTSHGNDGIVSRTAKNLTEMKGQEVWMIRYSISEQLFVAKAKSMNLDPYKDFIVKHMDSDAALRSAYMENKIDNVVTWNPALDAISNSGNIIATSADFPGIIVDMIVLGKDVDNYNQKANFLRALWDKTALVIHTGRGRDYNNLIMALVEETGGSIGEVKTMLKGSRIFTPEEEVDFYKGKFTSLQEGTYKLANENGFFEYTSAAYKLHEVKGGNDSTRITAFFDVK